ncbi:hypothetical protein Lfu02_61360 [Longispora fulva]|uniref:Uncharacterized protein n=1 Tax=Longispora fulva TaxID=619741 RepID=A0A8J7GEX0_9ACTN|nr:hypothetical protein [Longispora fulva]MBG6134558.1 hypothetical protein [Longispora fulva]GIG61764.1 hypothetical protein Lfu02_61360 [Longispora fulva]
MNDLTPPTSAQARERLATAQGLATTTARRGAVVGSITTAAVGVLMAGALAATSYFASRNPIALALSFAVYGIALALLMAWHRRTQVVAQRGFGRAYIRALITTIVLYATGVALLPQHLSWPWTTAYCVLVALPMLVTATRMATGARR